MNTDQYTHTKHRRAYSEGLTISLLHFARTNYDFACWFSQKILETFNTKTHEQYYNKKIVTETIFAIKNEQQAVHRALWLLYMLEHTYLQQNMHTIQVLTSWARAFQKEEPRAIILGLKYGIEPFGVWGEPKRKSHPMNILVQKGVLNTKTRGKLLQEAVTLSHSLVTKGLIQARGNTRRLEPELSDWLFGEKRINLYSARGQDLKKLQLLMDHWHAPHELMHDTLGNITHIATGPTVYLEDVGLSHTVERVA